jgi:hypothetical protein
MFAVLAVDYFGFDGRHSWDLSPSAKARPLMFLPWVLGFAVYQMIYPGAIGWWSAGWHHLCIAVHFSARPWMSASLCSFAVAAILTALLDAATRGAASSRARS